MVEEVEINWKRMVNAVVKKLRYSFRNIDDNELRSAAGMGLTLAYKKFEPDKWDSVIGFLLTKGYWMSFDQLRTTVNKNRKMIPFDNEILDGNDGEYLDEKMKRNNRNKDVSYAKHISRFEQLIEHLAPREKEHLRDRYLHGFLLKDAGKKANVSASLMSYRLRDIMVKLRQRMIRRDNLGWNEENITEKQSRQIVGVLKNPPPIKNL